MPTANPADSCTRGNYPVYVINATTPAHVQIGVIFARLFNLRLIIKNTGHDFLGKSLGFGSLSIWTHNFQDVTFIDKYAGPGGYAGRAVTVGAGVTTRDLYQMASAEGVVVVGGECEVCTLPSDLMVARWVFRRIYGGRRSWPTHAFVRNGF
jgi:FAD binding domain